MSNTDDTPIARIDPPGFMSEAVVRTVMEALPGSRAVGGCVRDHLIGRKPKDIDIATVFPPDEVKARLDAVGVKTFDTGIEHGTVTAVLNGMAVEVTTIRRDVSTDGRRATVAWAKTFREDAERRDFTINAMFVDQEGNLWDYFGGRDDLANGLIRFVGDARMRIAEDYLRILRFFRFYARYGNRDYVLNENAPEAFNIGLKAIKESLSGIPTLSVERIWMELRGLLSVDKPSDAVELMVRLGVWDAVLPEASEWRTLKAMEHCGAPADPLMRLAGILPSKTDVAALAARLKFSTAEARRTQRLVAELPNAPYPGISNDRLRVWVAGVVERGLDDATPHDVLWLAQARTGQGDWDTLRSEAASIGHPKFPLLGRDVLALGVPSCKIVGDLLKKTRDWWFETGCIADRDETMNRLRHYLNG